MTTVPYRLRRTESARPAAAFLLLSTNPADLLTLIDGLGGQQWPVVYHVPGGFLVRPASPTACALPPAIRLRSLAENLFVPADADLEPGLLPDEAAGLVRSRGLVFLPGGCELGFAPGEPLPSTAILTAPRRTGRDWRPLPPRPQRAEQLREVLLDRPEDTPDRIVDLGGENVGTEDPIPPPAGAARGTLGHAAVAFGRGLLWLANLLGWEALARVAAGVVSGTIDRVPQISESLLGRQEAALRALLREFREGSLERALRRALPLGKSTGRGSVAAQSAELPRHDSRFSLRGLLADGKGPSSVWFGGGDVHAQLVQEYRKAAAAAAARGDHRRAAFIYGKLLSDFRLAAAALERGGFHYEAAVLYLDKLGDTAAAARAFAAAGVIDRALQLYRRIGDHTAAGDLLRQSGYEDEALAEYTLAANAFAARGDFLSAGNLMQKQALRGDLARSHFAAGWSLRPAAIAVPCLLRLADLCAAEEAPANLLALVAEADEFLDAPGREADASQFYDLLVRFSERTHLAPVCADLRDLALLGIARQLRRRSEERSNPGTVVSALMGRSGLWGAAVVSDADFAFRAALKGKSAKPVRAVRQPGPVRLGAGPLTAACVAQETGVLFVGFGGGALTAFDPATGATARLRREESPGWPVAAIASDSRGDVAVTLRLSPAGEAELCSYHRVSHARFPFTYAPHTWRTFPSAPGCGLTPVLSYNAETAVGLWDGQTFTLLAGADLVPVAHVGLDPKGDGGFVGLLVPPPPKERLPNALRALGGIFYQETFWDGLWSRVATGWSPALAPGSSLQGPTLSWLRTDGELLHLAGIDDAGAPCYSVLRLHGATYKKECTARWAGERRVAATILAPGRLAAVGRSGVEWLLSAGGQLSAASETAMQLPAVSACFYSLPTNELLIVCENGDLLRTQVAI